MSDALNDLLARACTAFEQREEEDALRFLLPVWRETRAERIAVLVDRLSALLTARPAPRDYSHVSTGMELLRPWDLPKKLGGLLQTARSGRAAELASQLDAFRRWPADPRLTPALLDIARLPVAQEEPACNALGSLFMSLRDSRAVEELHALCAELGSENRLAQQLLTVIQRTRAKEAAALSPEALARCEALDLAIDALETATTNSAPVRESLLARIHAHPEDVDARLVLADLLMDMGDPLGEFIMLQCSPQPDPNRVEALLTEHRAEWQAPLGPSVETRYTRFERGFPVAVRVRGTRTGPPPPPPGPAWSTVESIDWSWEGSPEAATWLAHPHLRHVTQLRGVWASLGERLGAYPLPVRQLELQGQLAPWVPDVFRSLSALPDLSQVEIDEAEAADVSLCATSPLARRLERFEARVRKAWTLVATPPGEVQVEVLRMRVQQHPYPTQRVMPELNAQRVGELLGAIRAAAGFGGRVLRLHAPHPLEEQDAHQLERAGAGYKRVEWV
ncbi:TIGR02996 domain-containing protein [Pyxidicoccus xibeiensis]|uniref:TIGR02996 domain-containing protein n=1 Tax=Pyxidicoccus xibeiensis TaxID=2906759 RepID=UPI0020A6F6E0|nr:TIGR02996 domain-containing protein [Pyxidicoccus xibeiensis]MCP3135991.1 TIGR02996 domain-containing protein [Pyxidicoccus xibeiensis]